MKSYICRYVGFYQLARPALMIKDPELIKELTVKDFDHFTDHWSFTDPDVDRLWASNLFALKGKCHHDIPLYCYLLLYVCLTKTSTTNFCIDKALQPLQGESV